MIAFVIACQTSRSGLLSDPVDMESWYTFSKFMFSDIPEYHVYIVGDNECYDTARKFFGDGKVKGFRNVLKDTVNIRDHYVLSKWYCKETNNRFCPNINTNWCHLSYKLDIARKMIEESAIDYNCIATIRSDQLFQSQYQSYIHRVVSEKDVQFISNNGWVNIGKPDIMKTYMNMYNVPPVFYFDDKLSFVHSGIYPYDTFISCLKNPEIPKNSVELLMSMNVLNYCLEKGIDPDKCLFQISSAIRKSGQPLFIFYP